MADFPFQLVTRTFSDLVTMQCSLVQAFDGTVTTDKKFILLSTSSLNAGPFNRSGQNTVLTGVISERYLWYCVAVNKTRRTSTSI